ncbi:hypothetical protein KY311_01870, partial [Candidatus Woesearchaeota archaeon]|nr:hypothetical protein [Candidatus Woesearchaeota archaeon]
MEISDVVKKLKDNLEVVSSNYFIDNTVLKVADGSGTEVEAFNLWAMMFGHLMRKNILLIGEPGWGKTSAASIIASACTGLPIDLYRSVQISGHPDQTEEKMVARPDYGDLM